MRICTTTLSARPLAWYEEIIRHSAEDVPSQSRFSHLAKVQLYNSIAISTLAWGTARLMAVMSRLVDSLARHSVVLTSQIIFGVEHVVEQSSTHPVR